MLCEVLQGYVGYVTEITLKLREVPKKEEQVIVRSMGLIIMKLMKRHYLN